MPTASGSAAARKANRRQVHRVLIVRDNPSQPPIRDDAAEQFDRVSKRDSEALDRIREQDRPPVLQTENDDATSDRARLDRKT